jgi:hypothetical protein
MEKTNRFREAIKAFDEVNNKDPNLETAGGENYPKELLYSERMTEWLEKLNPEASEALRLAARCQHIERWMISREEYPMTRPGYLKWRNDLKNYHAKRAGSILKEAGYDEKTIKRVQDLVMKKGLKSDPEVQMLEDVICLVFLFYYFEDFAEEHNEEKLIRILKKTWRKMSEDARKRALNLKMPETARKFVEKAIA